jgi:hypothetical protein
MTEAKANNAAGAADDAIGRGKPLLHTRVREGQFGDPVGPPDRAQRGVVVAGRIFKIP